MAKQTKGREWLSLAVFTGLVAVTAATGARYSGDSPWYRSLRKPPFQPPPWLFAPVWTALYGAMAVSGWRVWRKRREAPEARAALGWWGTQLVLNGAWSYLFFGQHTPGPALADLVLLQAANVQFARTAAKVDRPAAWLWAPYLAWVTFAGVLNEEVLRLNR
jgi:tryptophan-rich sensory protein